MEVGWYKRKWERVVLLLLLLLREMEEKGKETERENVQCGALVINTIW